MSLELKISAVNKIEEQGFSFFEFDDINWWPLVRIYLFQNHQTENQTTVNKKTLIYPKRVAWEMKIWSEQKKRFKQAKANYYSKFKPSNVCFLTSETNYKKDANDNYINRYLDPLYLEETKDKCILVRSIKKDSKYVVNELLPTECFELQLKIKKQISIIFRTLFFVSDELNYSEKHKTEIDKIIHHIKTFSYFKEFNFSKLPKWFDKVMESYYEAQLIFKHIKPKKFVQYCYYFPTQFGYTLAANSLGITSVDYQHGIQNKFHYGYGSWANVPDKGYQLLPNEFWVFSQREANNLLNSFSNSTHQVKVIGNKWIEYWQKHKTNHENLAWLQNIKKNGNQVILYTVSNYLIDSNHFFWNYLKENNSDKFYFLFRLHPGHIYLKEKLITTLQAINFKNYNIEDATKTELYDLLQECDVHITQNSSVAEEALYFNKNTIIIDPSWKLYFENYISNGDMFVAHNAVDLEKSINNNLKLIKQ